MAFLWLCSKETVAVQWVFFRDTAQVIRVLDTAQKGVLQWWTSRTYLRKFLYFLLLCLHQVA